MEGAISVQQRPEWRQRRGQRLVVAGAQRAALQPPVLTQHGTRTHT
eukprot:CAMPEP_0197602052 /NCGR_PEP_ID=MMETSP1326-20131121/36449_1 /TAXON_ID=1155430 /ORGANISM="Genus nov. species nov., Strain RCC2288" /LENGTH=45 /DNA_ID= /DNA_START= /DNA_END= /DNA_ORIENTATION=